MKTLELTEIERPARERDEVIQLPYGLLGFEHVKKYALLANSAEAPFMWFRMLEDSRQAFLVVSPFLVLPSYQPDIANEEIEFLGIHDPADALILNIVTLRGQGQATVNLRGPIVINRLTSIGKQVIPINAAKYTLRHPLPVA